MPMGTRCGLEVDRALLVDVNGADRTLAVVVDRLDSAGAYERSVTAIEREFESAVGVLDEVPMPEIVRDEFVELASYVRARAQDVDAHAR